MEPMFRSYRSEGPKDQLELVKLLSSKECQLLKTGYKSQTMTYFFCSCDPDQKEPMCFDCYKDCHSDHQKKETVSYPVNAVCHCGMNCHRLTKDSNQLEDSFQRKCLFMDWSVKSNTGIYYQHNESGFNFCMFCANFCENIANLTKTVFSTTEFYECSCTGEVHGEVKKVFKKITELKNLSDFEFEFFTPTHMLNLIILSEDSFVNCFKTLNLYISKLRIEMKNDANYYIDSNIGYSAAMKALETVSTLADTCDSFNYFTDFAENLFDSRFVYSLLEKKFDYKSGKNIWILKSHVMNIYFKMIFQKDFEAIPCLSIKDIENLHPLQRILYARSVESQGDIYEQYFANLKFHPLESTMNLIERLNSIKDKNEAVYDILGKCYEITFTYANLAQFNKEQIMRYCSINDEVISGTETDKKIISYNILRCQLRMMISMIKSLLYLVYNHNDDVLEGYLSNQKDISKLNFFHSNSEVGKIINKNCINVLNYVRNSKRSLENEKEENLGRTSNLRTNTNLPRLSVINDTSEIFKLDKDKIKEEIEKLSRKVLVIATNITSISINYPDTYLAGLRSLMDCKKELYLKYIHRDSLNLSVTEKNFFEKIKTLKFVIEENYSKFFKFEITEDFLAKYVVDSIKEFFSITGINYQTPSNIFSQAYNEEPIMENKDQNYISNNPSPEVSLSKQDKKLLKNKTSTVLKSKQSVANALEVQGLITSKENIETKLKILVNKTLYIPSVIKCVKILLRVKEQRHKIKYDGDETGNFIAYTLDEELLEETLRLLYFYIENNPDNCMMLLTGDVLETFFYLNKSQISRFNDLLKYALFTIKRANTEMLCNTNLIKFLKRLVIKISGDYELLSELEKVIFIVNQLTEIKIINQEYLHRKLRQVMTILFESNIIFITFKNYLVESTSLYDSNKSNARNLASLKDEILQAGKEEISGDSPFKSHNKVYGGPKSFKPQMMKEDIAVVKTQKFITDIEGYRISLLFDIYIKFLRIINFLFDGNATLNEIPFLSKILSHADVPNILKKKDIELTLRIEILKFFRMSSIDVIIDKTKLEEYRSLFVNPINLPEEGGLFDDGYNYKFFNDLLLVNHYSLNLGLETAVIRYELKYFENIVDLSGCKDNSDILDYFQNGIILPLFVLLNKFMAIIYNLKGYEYLKLYEIVIYFLRMKKFLIENRSKFEKISNFELKSIFKSYLEIKKNKFTMINSGFTNEDYQEVIKDIEEMSKPHFEILNYKLVYSFFEKHLEGFITKPRNKSLRKIFEKKQYNYNARKVKKMDYELKGMGKLKTVFEKKLFDAIVKYENDKTKFSESAFVQNLGEHSIQFDSNYRALILKSVFFVVNDERLAEKYRKQYFWHLFKLLQHDTVPTQNEIFSLYQDSKAYINLPMIVNIFLENLLSLIFASCNPSSTVMNEDYYISITIVKLLKYMCEEHNINFQTIFFKELKFDFVTELKEKSYNSDKNIHIKSQISLFDFLLGIISKIVTLSKWEKVRFNCEENSISYFYDIFFVIIELLIEMVQGTKSDNLENIVKHSREEDLNPFNSFLISVKTLLLRDKNDSGVVYKVRKDITEFIVAFLEEKATPKKVISLISSVFNPYTVFETIVNTLKKLYFKKTSPNNPEILRSYKEEIFDHKKCLFFINTYFTDLSFCETPEFELSNRLYQYVKLLATQYENEDAINIIGSIYSYEEQELIDLYTKKLNKRVHVTDLNQAEVVLDDAYVQNYFAVKFFEKITRSVIVQKDNDEVPVLFTLNPLVPYLSRNTKNDFFDNVNRESRYTKLFSLMEYCDYFFDEINYNASKLSNNLFLKQLNKINYYYMEALLFLFTIVINLIMLIKIDTHEVEDDFHTVYPPIQVLAIIEVILNFLVLCAWFISKFPLYYTIEKKKYSLKWKLQPESLGCFEKVGIMVYNTIFLKNETNGFIWNIIFASVGISTPQRTFLFSIQLLIIINLSITLKNIIKSVTLRYKQLLVAAMFVVIMLYVFACIAFFFLVDDFVFTVGGGHRLRVLSSSSSSTLSSDHGPATAGVRNFIIFNNTLFYLIFLHKIF